MDFKQLQSFVAVVKYKSFTQAANHLYISQPTISAHVNQLEAELNKRLIVRTTKSIEITPKGQEVYDYAVNILSLKDRMIEACSQEARKIIHLGASTIPSSYILPEILPEFGSLYPDTYFSIHQNDSQGIMEGTKEGLFDIGLVGMRSDDELLECIPFYTDHMVVITPVNEYYLNMKQRDDLTINELMQEPIIFREQGSGSKKTADYLLERIGITEDQLKITARINDQEAIKNLVAGGLGISIISEMAARNFVSAKRILAFPLDEYDITRNLYLIYQKNYILKPYIQSFVNYIQKKWDKKIIT